MTERRDDAEWRQRGLNRTARAVTPSELSKIIATDLVDTFLSEIQPDSAQSSGTIDKPIASTPPRTHKVNS